MIRAAGASHAGLQRDQNEDRFLVDAAHGLFAVIDGVGGHAGGERASAIALDLLSTRLARETGTPAERLREAIALANNAVLDEARRDPSLAGMTCVLTAALISGRDLTVGHVGDTRIYKIHQGRIQKLTRDHSPVGEREDAGDISEAEAMRHPRRNEVYRDVGAQAHAPDDEGFVEVVETTFEPDAALVLCSDGLSDQVASDAIRRMVEGRAGEPTASVGDLIRAANDAGGRDNVTVIVVEGAGFVRGRAGRHVGIDVAVPTDRAPRVPSLARTALLLVAGILLGVVAAATALWMLRPDILRPPAQAGEPARPAEPRTWRVGLDAGADAASITDALAQAGEGDRIALAPGDYREAVVIARGVTIDGPREAVIRPPLGAATPWTAVTVTTDGHATITGVSVAGATDALLATGIRIDRGRVTMRNVAIAGASDAAIVIGAGTDVTIADATIHDNAGTGVRAQAGATLVMRHSSVLRNGTLARQPKPGVELGPTVNATFIGNAIGDNGGAAVAGLPVDAHAALVRDNLVRPVPRPPGRRPAAVTAPRAPSPQPQQ